MKNTNTSKFTKTLIALSVTMATVTGSSITQAQGGMLEEVIVTATKREAGLQDIAVTVNAFTEETILNAGINSTEDVAILTPSLNVTSNTSPFSARVSIRGVGTSQTDPALEPSVGIFVDGIYFSRSGLGMSELTDIQRVEVLQGPQGTLYGKNTNAGAISITTKKPNLEQTEGYIEATGGNYDLQKLTATVTGPISDTVAYRIAGNVTQRDGYFENSGSADDASDTDDWNLSAKVLFEPSESSSFLFAASRVERDTTCCGADATQTPEVIAELENQGFTPIANDSEDYKIATNQTNRFDMESNNLSLTADFELGAGTITSLTAWNDYEFFRSLDVDRSELDIFTIKDEFNSGDSFSQEIRFTSNGEDNLTYQVGLFYHESTTEQGGGEKYAGPNTGAFIGDDFLTIASQQSLPLPLPVTLLAQPGDHLVVDHVWDSETIAAFGQATWSVSDSLRFTGGLRWTQEDKGADLFAQTNSTAASVAIAGRSLLDSVFAPVDQKFDRTSEGVDWLANISYDLNDDVMLFAAVSTGTKSGGFNGANGDPAEREFDDEESINYELGIKSEWLENTLRINATAFQSTFEDYQTQVQQASGAGSIVSNEGDVETSGIDLNIEAVPLPILTLSAGVLYLDKAETSAGPNKGQKLTFAPEFSGTVAATFMFPVADGGLFVRTDYSYMGEHITNTANPIEQTRKALNATVGWSNEDWRFSVWGKNLNDEAYSNLTASTFSFSGMNAEFLTTPRTYGASVRYSF
jgi:iron complex outermembrane receptor protein